MASGTTEHAHCEKCGEDAGLSYYQIRTGEGSFGCGNCGWGWEISVRRFGQATLTSLREVLNGTGETEWGAVDVLLTSLARECREHGLRKTGGTLQRIERWLEVPPDRWTPSDLIAVRELAALKALLELADGEVVYDYSETDPKPIAR